MPARLRGVADASPVVAAAAAELSSARQQPTVRLAGTNGPPCGRKIPCGRKRFGDQRKLCQHGATTTFSLSILSVASPRIAKNTCQENALCSDGMLALLAVTAPLAMVLPKVSAPPNFVQPTPRPLTVTRPSEELPSLLTGGLVLAIRLATGVFTLGWSPKLLTGDEAAAVGTATGTYGFRFGPLAFRDTSPLLAGAPRPEQPLVLYEYEGSPFCRKVREAALLLDVPVEFRPCPGARAGFAAELKERTGRMTVRCASQARRGDWAYPTPWPSP